MTFRKLMRHLVMAGLTDNPLVDQIARDWEAHELLEASKERQSLNKSLAITLAILKDIADSRDIPLLLANERLLLTQEISLYANSPEEHNSITTALAQLDDAMRAWEIVTRTETYKNAAKTYPAKRMEGGLPLDGFREFIKSHSTRLGNRLAGRLAEPEKEMLRQRKVNLGVARTVYMALQRNALAG
jgi:hypothetical protein